MKKVLMKLLLPPLISLSAIGLIFALRGQERFDESLFQIKNVDTSVRMLSDDALFGRGLGEKGQIPTETYMEKYFKENQLDYEILTTDLLIPSWEADGRFELGARRYQLYEDYQPSTDYYSGSIDFQGEILYAGNAFFNIDPKLMKNRVVFFFCNRLTEEHMEVAKNAGAKGILYTHSLTSFDLFNYQEKMDHKQLDMRHKLGQNLFTAEISQAMVNDLTKIAFDNPLPGFKNQLPNVQMGKYELQVAGIVSDVKIKADLSHHKTSAKNYIVRIQGKSDQKVSNFITHYDGLGLKPTPLSNEDSKSDAFYPSTIDGAASTALLLELARTVRQQKEMPEQDIQFIFLSGTHVNDASAEIVASALRNRYAYNANWIIEGIGLKDSPGRLVNWDSYNDLDRMLASQLYSNLDRFPFGMISGDLSVFVDFTKYNAFKSADSARMLVTEQASPNVDEILGSREDNLDQYESAQMKEFSSLLMGHLDLQLFKEMSFRFVETNHLLTLLAVLMLIHVIHFPYKWISLGLPDGILTRIGLSIPYRLTRKTLQNSIPFVVSIFIVNLILSIPADVNMKLIQSTYVTNFSLYETIKNSYSGFIGFIMTLVDPNPALYKEISLYLKRSLILIFWGLGLSVALGLIKGLSDAYRHKGKAGLSTLSGIALYSIPDVLIAFVSLVAVVFLSKIPWVMRVTDVDTLRLFIMPILSLTIVPIIYISRLVFVSIEEEKKKDYVKFLAYKGLNKPQIYLWHFCKVALIKILDSFKAITMLIFSNLIVVEYLFNYPGIMYNLIESSAEPNKVIVLALSIGLSFIGIYLLSVLWLHFIHPGRRNQ